MCENSSSESEAKRKRMDRDHEVDTYNCFPYPRTQSFNSYQRHRIDEDRHRFRSSAYPPRFNDYVYNDNDNYSRYSNNRDEKTFQSEMYYGF